MKSRRYDFLFVLNLSEVLILYIHNDKSLLCDIAWVIDFLSNSENRELK